MFRRRRSEDVGRNWPNKAENGQALADDELSIGDYVLTNGALPAMVIIDSVTRLLPGALGHDDSSREESFSGELLEYPHYTRPADFRGMKVPEVLVNGNHEEIKRWRRRSAIEKKLTNRPDLLDQVELSKEDRELLTEVAGDSKT